MFLEPSSLNLNKAALLDDNGAECTYGDLSALCDSVARLLQHRSLVFMLADRQIDTVSFYYALQSCNHVVMLLNPEQRAEDLERYTELYQPKYIWGTKRGLQYCSDAVTVYETKDHCLKRTYYAQHDLHDQLALLLTTSGSTGNPKVVRLSKSNLRSNAKAFVDAISLRADDRGIVDLPIFYTYGLAICHMHFSVGATCY